jgi:hypothetical protein
MVAQTDSFRLRRREGQSRNDVHAGREGPRIRKERASDHIAAPFIESIDDASGRRADLPAEHEQDRGGDQRGSDHDSDRDTQLTHCPWCGGGLGAEGREAADRTREKMAISVSRYLAGDLTVTAGDTPDRPEEAKYSERAARYLAEVPRELSPVETSPNLSPGRRVE